MRRLNTLSHEGMTARRDLIRRGRVMVSHVKTAMDIADPLMRKAKRAAAKRGMTLKALVEEALRAALEKHQAARRAKPFRW